MAISFSVLGALVVLFVWNRLPVEVVAIGAALTLYATGVLELDEALGGFGDAAVIFIATLFVISESLDATGVTAWAGQRMIDLVGTDRTRLTVVVMTLCAALTALISVNGAVAALLPMVAVLAVRLGRQPSKLLMPLAFAAHAGSLLALTGTPVNVLISEAAEDAGASSFGYFDFALVGVPLLAGTIAIVVVFGERLLPDRQPVTVPTDLSSHPELLLAEYTIHESAFDDGRPETLVDREHGVAEFVVRPRSEAVGMTVSPGMVTSSGDLVVLAVERKGADQGPGDTILAPGDTVLLQGPWAALEQTDPDVVAVDDPAAVRRQAVPLGAGAKRAVVVLAAMVVALATGAIPAVVVGLLAALALVVSGVMTIDHAYRSINWTTVVLVGAMIAMSRAMQVSGAAEEVATQLVDHLGGSSPYLLCAGLFVVTAIFGQLISNMATALIVIPIGLSAATAIDVSPLPVLMGINVAAAAALLTPVATPVNLMIMRPAGYRFGDYWKLGLPLLAWFFVISVFLVPVFWSF